MAIAHDVTTNATVYAATGTQTTAHAANANARAAVVLIAQQSSTTNEVSGVTYGGTAMQLLGTSTNGTEAGRIWIYFLDGVAGGTQNVAMTTTASSDKYLSVSTMTVAANTKVSPANNPNGTLGVDLGYETNTSNSQSNPSLTLTGLTASVPVVAYEVIHSGLQTMTNTPQTSPAWTLIQSVDAGTQGFGMARIANTPSGTTLTAGWIAATADDFVIAGSAFYEDSLQTLSSAGNILSAESVSDPVLTAGAVTLASAGNIASQEAVGTPVANVIQNLNAAGGIASGEALGTPVLNAQQNLLSAGGIASGEAVGTPVANVKQNLNSAGGIASGGAVGTPEAIYANVMYVASIVDSTPVGTPTVSTTVTLAGAGGIASAQAVGTPVANVKQNLNSAGGIATPSAVGTPNTTTPATLSVTGIADTGGVGTPVVNAKQNLSVSGIAGTGAQGTPVLNTSITLTAVGIPDTTIGLVGEPTISATATLAVTGISSPSAVSTPSLAIIEETWGVLQLI